MARTHGRIKVEVWEAGSDFRTLSLEAQWAYQMLVSQPGISMCGVLAYTPKKWALLARRLTLGRLVEAIAELAAEWFVIVDEETDEILVRTFVKHDRPWNNPNLAKASRTQYGQIESESIKSYLRERHPWLVDDDLIPHEYEESRASERASERTLPLALERASLPARGRTRTAPTPTPTPTPEPTPDARDGLEGVEEKALDVQGGTNGAEPSEPAGLSFHEQIEKAALESVTVSKLEQLRSDPDAYVAHYATSMPPDILAEALAEIVPDETERNRLMVKATEIREGAKA